MPNLRTLSDDALVELSIEIGAQDERPFVELFRRHRTMVWRVCRRFFRDPQDVEDLVQETFFKAFRGLRRYAGGHSGSFRAWLARIAANVCKNELRTRSRRPTTKDDAPPDAAVPARGAGPLTRLLDSSRREALGAALAALSAKEREILVMADVEQTSYPRIAAELGLKISAVKMRVLRARAALAAAYGNLETRGRSDDET